jgi:hypothetical protein
MQGQDGARESLDFNESTFLVIEKIELRAGPLSTTLGGFALQSGADAGPHLIQ